jgi:hypothetical protein
MLYQSNDLLAALNSVFEDLHAERSKRCCGVLICDDSLKSGALGPLSG